MLVVFVPRNRVREAHVIFFFKQLLTWIFGLLVAEYSLIEYPQRFFSQATRASFTFEFFVYPAICVVFNLYYPSHGWFRIINHYIFYCTAITVFEVILERNTDLITYIHWEWYWTWLTLFITFLVSRLYYTWFFMHRALLADPDGNYRNKVKGK